MKNSRELKFWRNNSHTSLVSSFRVNSSLKMPLNEDYQDLRAQADADPERFRQWDATGRFSREYASLHSDDPRYSLEHQQNPKSKSPATTTRMSSSSCPPEHPRPCLRQRLHNMKRYELDPLPAEGGAALDIRTIQRSIDLKQIR
jgi:hypothetical protein